MKVGGTKNSGSCQALKVDQPRIKPNTFHSEDHAVNHSTTFLI